MEVDAGVVAEVAEVEDTMAEVEGMGVDMITDMAAVVADEIAGRR